MGKRHDTSITGIIHCRIASVLLISYVIIIHLFLILAISHSDILGVVKQKLGYLPAEISDFYKKSVGHHLRVDAQISPGAVIFLGDSIVQGLCVPCVSKQAYNFGIGGDTTVGVLQRLKYYQSVQQAGTVVLSVGTNDLVRRSSNEILSNYNKILASIPASVKIVLVAIFPVNTDGSSVRSRSNDQIRSINTQLAQLCKANKNCVFSDLGRHLTDKSGSLSPDFDVGDGLHLNTKAYQLWIAELRKLI